MLAWAEPFEKRTWAIESAGGLGYLLAQQLVAAGETVLDVPATLASRVRVLGTGRSNKNDPNDALSVAIAALRAPALRPVEPADHAEVLRLLAKRNIDIGSQRTRVVCRLHALLAELAPGGIAKELNASDVVALLERIHPATPVEQARHDLAVELLDDVRRLDAQLKESHRRIRDRGARIEHDRSPTCSESDRSSPAMLIGYTGDVAPVPQPRPVRRVQRHRTRRALLRRSGRASTLPAREPPTQPRVPPGRDLPDPPDRTPKAAPTSTAKSPRARPRRKRSAR